MLRIINYNDVIFQKKSCTMLPPFGKDWQLINPHWLSFVPYTKQATLMRRSTVLSLPLQLVFPGYTNKAREFVIDTQFCPSLLFVSKPLVNT